MRDPSAGAYTDPETGLLYLINRYYDPTTGQFLAVDPAAPITGAPYTYANDNPVNETDPNGLLGLTPIHQCADGTTYAGSSGGCSNGGPHLTEHFEEVANSAVQAARDAWNWWNYPCPQTTNPVGRVISDISSGLNTANNTINSAANLLWQKASCVAGQFNPFGAQSPGFTLLYGVGATGQGAFVIGAGTALGGPVGLGVTVLPGSAEIAAGRISRVPRRQADSECLLLTPNQYRGGTLTVFRQPGKRDILRDYRGMARRP